MFGHIHQGGFVKTEHNIKFDSYSSVPSFTRKIMVVEDEPFWQLLIDRALSQIDGRMDIRYFENARQALNTLDTQSDFDLIFSDYNLKGEQNGLDLWDILQEKNLDIPYVLISGTRRVDFLNQTMPHRTEFIVPHYIEKAGTIRELSYQLNLALSSHLPVEKSLYPRKGGQRIKMNYNPDDFL